MASNNADVKLRACSTCARLKMKCRWPENTDSSKSRSCIRCTRMKTPCDVPEQTKRRRRGKSTQVAQLEAKLDGLVNMIAAQQKQTPPNPVVITPESQSSYTRGSTTARERLVALPHHGDIQEPEPSTVLELMPDFKVTVLLAGTYLDRYRNQYMPKYPFVLIPSDITAYGLYRQKPALFWAIMVSVVPVEGPVAAKLRVWFREYFATQVFVEQQKTTALIQAILVYISWSIIQNYVDIDGDDLLAAALSIINTLRLDKPAVRSYANMQSLMGTAWTKLKKDIPFRYKEIQTEEDKRAVLGCYHISAIISSLLSRGPFLRWNPHLESFCNALVEEQFDELDLLSVALTRMISVAESSYSVLPGHWAEAASQPYSMQHEMIIDTTERKLASLLASFPPSIRSNTQIQNQYQVCLMRLYEPAIMMQPPAPAPFESTRVDPFMRAGKIWKFLACAKELFRVYFEGPLTNLVIRPYHECCPIAFAVISSSRVLFLDAADWQPSLARLNFDYVYTIGTLVRKYEEAGKWARQANFRVPMVDEERSIFEAHGTKLKYVQAWFNNRVDEENGCANVAMAESCGDTTTTATTTDYATQHSSFPVNSEAFSSLGLDNLAAADQQFWQELLFTQIPQIYDSATTT